MRKLKTLIEYVIENDKKASSGGHYDRIIRYANFLIQPLTLNMFIPCKDGEPLEDPKEFTGWMTDRNSEGFFKEYQKAKERVIFKGFEIRITKYKNIYSLFQNGNFITSVNNRKGQKLFGIWEKETISDLCNKVDLVDKVFKRLGL